MIPRTKLNRKCETTIFDTKFEKFLRTCIREIEKCEFLCKQMCFHISQFIFCSLINNNNIINKFNRFLFYDTVLKKF